MSDNMMKKLKELDTTLSGQAYLNSDDLPGA
jgi:hypothetical protein